MRGCCAMSTSTRSGRVPATSSRSTCSVPSSTERSRATSATPNVAPRRCQPAAAVAPLGGALIDALHRVEAQLGALNAIDDPDARQLPLRRIARRMATLAIGARLAEEANEFAADTGSGRLGWIASRYVSRLGGERALAEVADDASWLPHADALLHGGDVPISVASDAARRTAQRSAPWSLSRSRARGRRRIRPSP